MLVTTFNDLLGIANRKVTMDYIFLENSKNFDYIVGREEVPIDFYLK